MAPTGSGDVTNARPDRLRTHAIERYCHELCGPAQMSAAAADAVESVSPADAWGGDDALLRVTRTAAARHAPARAAPSGWRGMLAAEHQSDCDLTPSLLAQRANGELPPARQATLENHLDRCLYCRAAELREHRATRAFAAVIATGDPRARRSTALTPTGAPPPEPPPVTEVSEPPQPPEPTAPPRRGLVVFPASSAASAIPATPPQLRRHHKSRAALAAGLLTAYLPFFATLAVGAVLVVVIALTVGSGAQAQNAATSLPPPSAASTPPPSVGIAATQNAAEHQTHTTVRHPSATTPTTTPTTSAVAVQTTAAAPAANPAPRNAPAANPPPASRQPARPSPTTTSSPPVVVSQQGTGLPAATAPTQSISGGAGGTSTTH